MFGVLNINKPTSWTSRDVVNRVQRLVRPAKAGHAGTLDPLATGVLVVCVGPATRLINYVQQLPKAYEATFLLGRTSPSDDVETEMQELADAPKSTQADIIAQIPKLVGSVQQRPPAYSALKVKGKRAYQLARQGQSVTLEPRTVRIDSIEIVEYSYPELRLSIRCGSGTYVRSIGRDLAELLGTGAVMSALERTAIGSFNVAQASDVETLDLETLQKSLQPPISAVAHLPQLELSEAQIVELRHGRTLPIDDAMAESCTTDAVLAALDPMGQLIALVCQRRPGRLAAVCNFV